MKKVICILLVLVMVLSLAACGKQPVDQQPEGTKEPAPVQGNDNQETEATKEQTPPVVEQENTEIRVPGEKIYFYAPSGWEVEKENLSTVIKQSKDCLVSICYNWPMSYEFDLVEMISRLGYNFTADADSEGQGYIVNSTIEATSTEKSTIAGYDCVVFTGVVSNDGNWNCHVYGYTFVVNNVELMVVCIVSTQAQDAQMIADINALTDQIAASVTTK